MRRLLNRLWRRRDGVTAMEFALAAPVVTLFVAGIVEVGMMLFALTLMEASVRESSRFGITGASGAAGVSREQAIRAVRLAAPFDLPTDLYAAWKHVASFRFDRKLSQ